VSAFEIPSAQWIEKLPGLPDSSPDYVGKLVQERQQDLRNLPEEARQHLENCRGKIVDVGPGEGVSSMALARFAPHAQVLGIEMDRKHLVCAYPECRNFANLQLAWGTVRGTPSNSRVSSEQPIPPVVNLPDGGCEILFTWLGMSRNDLFQHSTPWYQLVERACILVIPQCWAEGLEGEDRRRIESFCRRLGIAVPTWRRQESLFGFRNTRVIPLGQKAKARGWLLWLSGIFDSAEITLWDTLVDRGTASPKYQLPEVVWDLAVIVGTK
jgi:hypothetical protein